MSADDARVEALALVEAWHQDRPRERLRPSQLAIREVAASYVHVVAVTRIAEVRGVQPMQTAPEKWDAESAFGQPAPDPWGVPGIDIPADAQVGSIRARLVDGALTMLSPCDVCGGTAGVTCPRCDGAGSVYEGGRHTVARQIPCPVCGGRASVPCGRCRGLGGFTGPPQAWAKLVETTTTRFVGTDDIASAAKLDVDPTLPLAKRVLQIDPWSADAPAVGYRDAGARPFHDEARALAAEQDANHRSIVRARRMEVRRIGVYRVTLGDGRVFHVWGPPAHVSPLDALDRTSRPWLPIAGIALLAITALATYFFSMR